MSHQFFINPHGNHLVARGWHSAKHEATLECTQSLPSLELYHQQVAA